MSVQGWIISGQDLLNYLDTNIQEMTEYSKSCSSERVAGSWTGVAGGIGVLAGIALAPFTAGASAAAVALGGTGLTFVGGTISTASSIAEIREENKRADKIKQRLEVFLKDSENLLKFLSENNIEFGQFLDMASRAVQHVFPCLATGFAAKITGAHGALMREPPSSYFFPSTKPETLEIFGYKVSSRTVHTGHAFVGTLGAIWSIVAFYHEIEKNKRIETGRTRSPFVNQLIALKDVLQKYINDVKGKTC